MISKSPSNTDKFKCHIEFTNSAREGWGMILKTLQPDSEILLPSYIGVTDREGSGIYDPVIESGVKHDFYLLNSDLSIPISEIENKIKNKRYALILLVHYFGFKIQNIEDIVKLCKKHQIIVVEDCAHLYNYNMFHISDAGTFGDLAFYSLHKNFALKNGGLLVRNNIEHLSIDNSGIDTAYGFSETLSAYRTDLIAKKRIDNFEFLDVLISNIKSVKPLKKISKGDIPHNYPIIVKGNLREKLYFWLIEKNITLIALYYRLIEPLQAKEYKEMQYVSNNILNLPVHQDVEKKDLDILVKLIEEALVELDI
ncbi:DegT/DnrJ/EryC1/StrS family aminotransferase [Flavobacteriaceae bacterium XHP0103]|uniref:DegT/DnrJ/EryC1/StrS family aminotransferase n=1 Tax=Marixanthotalea marina TaxID=2844359 RepID=UPI002989E49B|nr:DegT/DnrJ/EryC1/StrS family aminotransferase [Marixanthotalea marina]MBU3822751.1 DegT/DnrJ/EryC1/StrS family aminotransferase [Marixanthotalea marina]